MAVQRLKEQIREMATSVVDTVLLPDSVMSITGKVISVVDTELGDHISAKVPGSPKKKITIMNEWK